MAGAPEIAVRLTAQGVADVIAAFQRVRQEAQQTGQQGAAGIGVLNKAVGDLSGLLPALSFTAAVAGMTALVKGALDSADAIGRLSQKTGTSVETLSVLTTATRGLGVDSESLTTGLTRLAKSQQDAANGSTRQLTAFKQLGISISQLNTLNPGDLFVTMSQKLAALPDGAQKTNIALTLLGRGAADLIPVMNQLGTEGFDAAKQRAEQLGTFLSQDMVNSAHAAKVALADLALAAQGVANQFLAGFAPKFTQALEMVNEAVAGEGVNGFKQFGDFVGQTLKGLSVDIVYFGALAKTVFQDLKDTVTGSVGAIQAGYNALKNGEGLQAAVGSVIAGFKSATDTNSKAFQQRADSLNTLYQKLTKAENTPPPPAPNYGTTGGAGAVGDGSKPGDADKNAKAYSELLQARAANELAILKTKDDLANAQDQRAYQAGLLSLNQYYDQREARINAESDAEITLLQQKRAAAQKLPASSPDQADARQKAIEAIDTQITEVQLKQTGALKAAEDDRAKDRQANALKELELQKELQTAAGNTAGAAETGLDIEIEKYEQLLKTQGKSLDEIKALSDAARTMGQAKIDFGTNYQAVETSLQQMDQQVAAINDQVANGAITQIAGQRQVHDLEAQRIRDLQSNIDLMQEQVALSKDPAQMQQLQALIANMAHLKSTLQDVTTPLTYLENQLDTVGKQSTEDFFTSIIDGSKSAGAAFKDLGDAFAQIVAQMVSKLLIFYALEEIVGFVAPDSDFAKNLSAAGPFGKYDAGGWTGNAAPSAVAGVVHGQEFVVKAGPAARNRALLEAINNGINLPAIAAPGAMQGASDYATSVATARLSGVPGYQDGGFVGGPASTSSPRSSRGSGSSSSATSADGAAQIPPPLIYITNTTGQPVQQKQTTGPQGQSITQIVIGAVAQDIAKRGQVGQAIEASYGVNRAGTKRG